MLIKYNHTFLLFLLSTATAMLGSSCEKTVTVSSPAYTSKLSIQCMLEPDSVPVLYCNKTVPYFDKKVNFADLTIRTAKVSISNGVSVDVLQFDSAYDRLYCQYNYFYKGHIPVQLNTSYTLSLSNGSEQYSATASTSNLSKVLIDSTSYTPAFSDLYGEHEGVIVYFRNPGQGNYYRYSMSRFVDTTTKRASEKLASPCLGKDSLRILEIGRSVYRDAATSTKQIKIVVEPAYTHVRGTTGLIYIETIDKNAFDFFDQLDKQKLSQFNPFVEPVFLSNGQFGPGATGYFSAKVNSAPARFIYPE